MNTNQIILLNDILKLELEKYKLKTTDNLKKSFQIASSAKNINSVIFQRIIDNSEYKNKLNENFDQNKVVIKTVNLEWNNSLKESMSLNVFKYCDIVNEEWQNSKLRDYFFNSIFVFVVFKKTTNSSVLEDIKVWTMPIEILDGGVRKVWEDTKDKIANGKIVNYIDTRGRNITYFLASSDTKYIHVRPHAQNKMDTLPLPVPDKTTGATSFVKQSFWLNSNFIKKIVVDGRYYE